jgi:Rieske Fe-S protein
VAEQPEPTAWREDFPIDWAEDQYVERRDFVKFLVLISGAFTAGQFWIATEEWFRRRETVFERQRIASLDQLASGTVVFNYPGPQDPCVLVRTKTGELVAYSQKCTHLSCAVIPRPELGVLQCPCHEGLFELSTGRPIAGPPPRPLPRITIAVDGNDVFATGVVVETT